MASLERALEEEREHLSLQRDSLAVSHSRERSSWEREREMMRDQLQEEIAGDLQGHLEVRDDFVSGRSLLSFDTVNHAKPLQEINLRNAICLA